MSNKTDRRISWPAGLAAVEAAIAYGGTLYGESISDDFNAAFDHIFALLADSVALFERQSFSTSAFVAITAIEETAKAHIAIYRKGPGQGRKKGRDPLREHKKKHHMAVLPTVFMGERLIKALGEHACARLQAEAETDGFTKIREAALYCARLDGRFMTPGTAVSPRRAWELLLLAIETLDDSLVGYTDHSMAKSRHLDALFDQIAVSKPGE